MKNVLVSLYKGYGLGDAVMTSVILQHLAKHRPDWRVDFQAEMGRYCVGNGIVSNTFAYGQLSPTEHYDLEFQIVLYDKWYGFTDRPNTHIVACLRDTFDIPWDKKCGRYKVAVTNDLIDASDVILCPGEGRRPQKKREAEKLVKKQLKTVAVHYEGDSAACRKNLTHEQATGICKEVEKLGYNPLLIDWRNTSPLYKKLQIKTTGSLSTSGLWGGDVAMNCAVVSQCAAFVGIDSGPAKCASATDTPSLVVWTDHHPAQFHDPAPNTTHLVPWNYHDRSPVSGNQGVVKWFEQNYRVRQYEYDPVYQVSKWLGEVLKR